MGVMWNQQLILRLPGVVPRAKLRWADVRCQRCTNEVNVTVNTVHCAHVGPTYQCYPG